MSITINGTTGISGVDGSSTAPAFQGNDTNTGLFYGTDIVGISTGGSERVRVDASGNVGIGTTSPHTTGLTVYKASGSSGIRCQSGANSTDIVQAGTELYIVNNMAGPQLFYTNSAERMRIDSSGNVLVGTTSTTDSGGTVTGLGIGGRALTTSYGFAVNSTSATGTQYFVNWGRNGSSCGGITSTGTNSTSYNTSSDYRLKENIAPMTGALDKVTLLNPVTYTWKEDGSDGQGFIAHELQEVVPDCVTGKKDAVDAEGNPVYQGVDTSFLVATLTAAIQEQQTIINDLKARVTALEANNV